MIGTLGQAAIEELAFEGPPGATWSILCKRLQTLGFSVDATVAPILFQGLISSKEVEVKDADGSVLGDVEKHALRFEDVSDDRRILQKSKVVSYHFMVKTQTAIRALGLLPHPELVEAGHGLRALQVIAKSREEGVLSDELAKELQVAPRDLFYQIEGLRNAGIVVCAPRRAFDYEEAMRTFSNRFIHRKYFDLRKLLAEEMQHVQITAAKPLEDRMLLELNASKSKMLLEVDLRSLAQEKVQEWAAASNNKDAVTSRKMGARLYQKVRQTMVQQQKVECVRFWDKGKKRWYDALCLYGSHRGDEGVVGTELTLMDKASVVGESQGSAAAGTAAASSTDVPASRRARASSKGEKDVRPRHPEHASTEENNEPESDAQAPQSHLRVRERPLPLQVLDLIEVSGYDQPGPPVGITGPDIADTLGIKRKTAERTLGDLHKMGAVVRILESDGRMHRNRFFVPRHAKLVCSAKEVMASAQAKAKAACQGQAKKKAKEKRNPAKSSEGSNTVPFLDRTQRGTVRKRLDLSLEKLFGLASQLLQDKGYVHTLILRKKQFNVEKKFLMDRRTAQSCLQRVASQVKGTAVVRREDGTLTLVYLKDRFSAEEASQAMLRDQAQARSKPQAKAPAATSLPVFPDGGVVGSANGDNEVCADDSQAGMGTKLEDCRPAHSQWLLQRRTLDTDESMRQLFGPSEDGKDTRQLQQLMVYYGYQSSVLARAELLHGYLLKQFGVEAESFKPLEVLDNMDLKTFLQTCGLGTREEHVEQMIRDGQTHVQMKDLPRTVYNVLLRRTYQGSRQSVTNIRRLMGHLVRLQLVELQKGDGTSLTQHEQNEYSSRYVLKEDGRASLVVYKLLRYGIVNTFTADVEKDPPRRVCKIDFAQSGSWLAFWKALQAACMAWINQVAGEVLEDEALNSTQRTPPSRRRRTPSTTDQLPANSNMLVLFQSKNWSTRKWITKEQRLQIDAFHKSVVEAARQGQSQEVAGGEAAAEALRQSQNVVNARSPEVLALSEKIGVAPERIVRMCEIKASLQEENAGNGDAAPVIFTSKCQVRYRCHLCTYMCFLRGAIEEHYRNAHGSGLPSNEELFCERDYYTRRLAQAQTLTVSRRTRRTRGGNQNRPPSNDDDDDIDDADHNSSEVEENADIDGTSDTHTEQRPAKRVRLDDDLEWARLAVLAERMAAQRKHERYSIPAHSQSMSRQAWSLLGRMLGRSGRACRRRILMMKKDRKNASAMAGLRRQAAASSGPLLDLTATSVARSLAAAAAKALSLTLPRPQEPWWHSSFFAQDVAELVAWSLEQWRANGLLTRHKNKTHLDRLPLGSRPSFLLSFQGRDKLYGRQVDLAGWHAATVEMHRLAESAYRQQTEREVVDVQITGNHLLAWLPSIADGSLALETVWDANEDFYRAAAEKPCDWAALYGRTADISGYPDSASGAQSLAAGSESVVSGDSKPVLKGRDKWTSRGGLAKLRAIRPVPAYKGTRLCSKRAAETDCQKRIRGKSPASQALCADALDTTGLRAKTLQKFLLSEEEVKHLAEAATSYERIDPGVLLREQFLRAGNDEPPAEFAEASEGPKVKKAKRVRDPDDDPIAPSKEAFMQHFAIVHSNCKKHRLELMFDMAAFLLRTLALESQAASLVAPTSSDKRRPRCRYEPVELLPAARSNTCRNAQGCCISTLRSRWKAEFPTAADELFGAAVASLEELRLAVPVSHGDELVEVLAPFATPFTIKKMIPKSGAPPDNLGRPTMAEALGLFDALHPGRHWGCDAFPAPKTEHMLAQAAAALIDAAGIARTSDAVVQTLLLPRGLVSPAVWVAANGHLNGVLLRFFCLRLLCWMDKMSGLSAKMIAQQVGLVDVCEAQMLLSALLRLGICHQETCASSGETRFHSRALHRLRQAFERNEVQLLCDETLAFGVKGRPPATQPPSTAPGGKAQLSVRQRAEELGANAYLEDY